MIRLIKNHFFWLGLILIVGLFLRLYKIDSPIADWHSWRQADTAAVSRNFYQEEFNPFLPKYDNMIGEAGNYIPNLERFRFVEFPIYNSLVYLVYLIYGGVNEILARVVSILFSLGSTVFIFLITKKHFGTICAFLSALLFAILPFNVYFSRTILPEPSLVFFCLGMFYFVNRWIFENTTKLFIWGLIFTSLAFLTKPTAIFYLLPFLYSYYQKEGKFWPIPLRYFKMFIPALLPFFAWRIWILQYPEGIPASGWLLNGNGIRFKPAFWKWIIGDRFGREILSVTGTVLFFLGLLLKPKPGEGYLLHLLGLSMFLYLVVFATGNVQHDYYQTLIIPALVIFMSRGFLQLLQGIPNFLPRIWIIPIALLFLPLTIYLSWQEVRGLYQINNPIVVEAGKKADQILPKEAVVVAPYNGDTTFLYHVNRPGWAIAVLPLTQMIDRFGVTHYISVNRDQKTAWILKYFNVLEENPSFVIVDLTWQTRELDPNDPEPL